MTTTPDDAPDEAPTPRWARMLGDVSCLIVLLSLLVMGAMLLLIAVNLILGRFPSPG